MMIWEERYELDRALEYLMDKIERDDFLTEEEFETLETIYEKAETWEDYNRMKEMYKAIN